MANRTTLITLLLALALLAPISALAQGPPDGQGQAAGQGQGATGERGPGFDPRERAQSADGGWQNVSQQMREQARMRAEQARLFGLLEMSADNVSGRYIQFTFDEQAGTLSDYAVMGEDNASTTFFDSVRVEPATNASEPVVRGPMFRWALGDSLLVAHDNPTSQLRIHSAGNDTTVTLALAEGVQLNDTQADAGEENATPENVWRLEADGRNATLILTGEGDMTVNGDTLTADLGTNGSLVFLAHPPQGGVHATSRDARVSAIAEGRLGGEISIIAVEGTPAADVVDYGVQLRPVRVDNESVVVNASSENETGRAVIVLLPAEALGNATAQQIRVLLDGEALENATSGEDLLNETVGMQGRYHAEIVQDVAHVVVTIPGFSDHEITIQTSGTADGTDGTGDGTTPTDGTDGTGGTDTTDGTGGTDGTTEPPADEDTPAPGLMLVLALVGTVALVARRRRA